MGLHPAPPLNFRGGVPFGKTVYKIEQIRSDIETLRKQSRKDDGQFEHKLLKLEDKLRTAYAELSALAAAKVAKWRPGPKLKK